MTFGITPVAGFPPATDEGFPQFLQFQAAGVNLGGPDATVLNFLSGATRGTGANSNVITVADQSDAIKLKAYSTLQGAVDDAQRLGKALDMGSEVVSPSVPTYFDVSKLCMFGRGAVVNVSAINTSTGGVADAALVFASSGAAGSSKIQSLGFSGFLVVGNGSVGRVGMQYGTNVAVGGLLPTAQAPCVTFDRIGCANIDIADKYVSQAFDIKHNDRDYESCGATNAIWIPPGGVNYGESIAYNKASFHNCNKVMLQDYVASQVTFSQSIFDYSNCILHVRNGWCFVYLGYTEQGSDLAPLFITENDALLRFLGTQLNQSFPGPRVNFPLFQSLGTQASGYNKGQSTRTGIIFRDGLVNFGDPVARKFLCDGPGASDFTGTSYTGFALSQAATPRNTVSASSNLLNNGDFATGIVGWTTAGSVTWDATGGNGGGGSVKMVYDQESNFFVDTPMASGDTAVATFDVATSGFGTGRFVNVHLYPMDLAGNILGDSSVPSIGNDSFNGTVPYATAQTRFCNLPRGTAKVRLLFRLDGGPVGTGLVAHFDNINLCRA